MASISSQSIRWGTGFLRHLQRGLTPAQISKKFIPLQVAANGSDAKAGPTVNVGWMTPAAVSHLKDFSSTFDISSSRVLLRVPADKRTEEVAKVSKHLLERKIIRGWRNELMPVGTSLFTPQYFDLERAASGFFGIKTYGSHLNAFVSESKDGRPTHMWIGRRALTKSRFPGKLDQLVAGGIATGQNPWNALVRECTEEANMDEKLATRARGAGYISYRMVSTNEVDFKDGQQFVFDLEVPSSFKPSNSDGEVSDFYYYPIAKVAQLVADTDEFKWNCNLVIIDFLIRHGFYGANDDNYSSIMDRLRSHPTTPSRL